MFFSDFYFMLPIKSCNVVKYRVTCGHHRQRWELQCFPILLSKSCVLVMRYLRVLSAECTCTSALHRTGGNSVMSSKLMTKISSSM